MRSSVAKLALVALASVAALASVGGCSDDANSNADDASSSGSPPVDDTGDPPSATSSGDTTTAIDASSTSGETGTADVAGTTSCGPSGGGPHWLLEGDPLVIQVACDTGIANAGDRFELLDLPAGAVYDPATATLSWTPGLDQGGVYSIAITAIDFREVGTVKIGVADRWDAPDNVPVVDPTIYTEEFGLPVLHLQTAPDITDELYTPAVTVYRGHTYAMEAKLRGAASLGYPKNSYTLKFTKDDKFQEPDLAGGFVDKRKLVLISTFDDNAYVRQRLAYELWNALDPEHLQIQVYSGVVFLNGAYYGLYTFSDHVSDYLMEEHGLSQDGNLYKARTHDANFRLAGKSSPHDGLTKEEGLPLDGEPGAYDDLDAFITFVDDSSDAEFDADVDAWCDRRDYENWWIFVSLIMGDDSAGKNSYHYHDPLGGPWRFAPWDFNDSFGQTWQSARKGFDVPPEDYTWANEMFVRLLDSDAFGAPLRDRYAAALGDGPYAIDQVLARYDAMVDETSVSAHRDEGRWRNEYLAYPGWNWRDDFTTYDEEVEYMRQWLVDRWAFVGAIYP